MLVRKDKAGSAPGYTWDKDGQVLEVPDALGADLVAIPGGGFTEIAPGNADEPVVEAPPAPKPRRPRKTAAEADTEIAE